MKMFFIDFAAAAVVTSAASTAAAASAAGVILVMSAYKQHTSFAVDVCCTFYVFAGIEGRLRLLKNAQHMPRLSRELIEFNSLKQHSLIC